MSVHACITAPLAATWLLAAASAAAAAEAAAPVATATKTEAAAPLPPASEPRPAKSLDLRPPDITKLVSAEQLQALLARSSDGTIEEVEVYGDGTQRPPSTPTVWPGIAAPFWALAHPLQAWRIIAPLPPDQTRAIRDRNPDTESPYLEPAAVSH